MEFRFNDAMPVLQRTRRVLRELLRDLPKTWTEATEGAGTWSPVDVIGHLIHGERTNWVPRVEHMLKYGDTLVFPAFDRDAMFSASKGRTLGELLDEFEQARAQSLTRLGTWA